MIAWRVLLFFALLLTAGCVDELELNDSAARTPRGSRFETPTRSGSPTPFVVQGLTPARVTRVVDGDTIRVEIDGEEFRVRYIGIDTPETVDPRRPVECFGKEASERNRQLVDRKIVGLEKDVSETDSFGRLLRYVWIGDKMVNATLVEDGYALASTYPPDVKHAELFASLQARARESGRGLWGEACASEPPPSEQ